MHTAVLPTDSRSFEPRRHTAAHTSRLVQAAFVVTGTAALVAWLLASVVHLSEQAVVLSVMTIAFVTSWIVTNRRPASHHRVTLIPAPVRTH